jgi:hypothetical protein
MKIKVCGVIAAAMVVLSGCASNERQAQAPNDFADAEASLRQADQAGAQRYASRELNLARQELDQAREAAERGDHELAARLAKQAEVDAELAAATAGNEEMQAAVAEMRAGLQTLRDELQRNER